MISWRLLLSACLNYLTLLCNVNFLLTAVLLFVVVVVVVVVGFCLVLFSFVLLISIAFLLLLWRARAHSKIGRIFVCFFFLFFLLMHFHPRALTYRVYIDETQSSSISGK